MDNLLALATLHGIGFTHKDLKKIFEKQTEYVDFFENLIQTKIISEEWITSERKIKILERLDKINISNMESIIKSKDIKIITINSESYPEKLRTISQAPYLIYTRGNIWNTAKMLGVVGSRKSTNYGRKILEKIIPELVQWNCGIISGGAHGIDTLSHELALENNGHTISVFGSWIDIFYPKENTALFEKIITHNWVLISIFPIGTKPEPYYFPIRNEIVAALSDGIIIPEAGEKSGTLITAHLALEHGRDVFAVPGDIFRETSIGTNNLIAKGEAKCAQSAKDILEEYFHDTNRKPQELDKNLVWESEEEKNIYNSIVEWNNTPDSISEKTEYPVHEIMMHVSMMEINWLISLDGNGKYEINN